MKIALCISGQPRNVELAFDNIERFILKPNSPDVFIHTWWSDDMHGQRFVQASQRWWASDALPPNIPEIINRLYSPTVLLSEPQRHFPEKNFRTRMMQFNNPFYTLSGLYSVLRANQLRQEYEKERGVIYDRVIRLRFDWNPGIVVVAQDYDAEHVWVENGCPHPCAVGDQFAIATPEYMNIYANLFEECEKWWEEGNLMFDQGPLLWYHLQKHNVPVGLLPFAGEIVRKADPR